MNTEEMLKRKTVINKILIVIIVFLLCFGFFIYKKYFNEKRQYEIGKSIQNAMTGIKTNVEEAAEKAESKEQEEAENENAYNPTIGERNALKSGKSYLEFMPFSYSGLIEQLEYEKYSKEEAVYAADNCGADWNEQAAKCAENYLEFMPFSKEGLIEQLEYEGFTHEQAVYGAEQNGY